MLWSSVYYSNRLIIIIIHGDSADCLKLTWHHFSSFCYHYESIINKNIPHKNWWRQTGSLHCECSQQNLIFIYQCVNGSKTECSVKRVAIHPLSISLMFEVSPAVIRQEAGYSLNRLTVHCRIIYHPSMFLCISGVGSWGQQLKQSD